jgi:hypothetical protein
LALAAGVPGDAVLRGVGGVERLAAGDAGDLRGFAAEGCQFGWSEHAERGSVPGGCGESAVFEGEDQRLGDGFVAGGVVGEGDLLFVTLPVGVPGLGVLVMPFLLEDGGAVCGELDEEDAMDILGDAAAAGVEAVQLVGVGRGGESREQQGKSDGAEAKKKAHGSHRTQCGRMIFNGGWNGIDLAA